MTPPRTNDEDRARELADTLRGPATKPCPRCNKPTAGTSYTLDDGWMPQSGWCSLCAACYRAVGLAAAQGQTDPFLSKKERQTPNWPAVDFDAYVQEHARTEFSFRAVYPDLADILEKYRGNMEIELLILASIDQRELYSRAESWLDGSDPTGEDLAKWFREEAGPDNQISLTSPPNALVRTPSDPEAFPSASEIVRAVRARMKHIDDPARQVVVPMTGRECWELRIILNREAHAARSNGGRDYPWLQKLADRLYEAFNAPTIESEAR